MAATPAILTDHAVIGASDLPATVAFFTALGFTQSDPANLDAAAAFALYAIPEATQAAFLTVPGTTAGIRVIATPFAAAAPDPYHRGGHALDLYTTDLDQSLSLSQSAGATVGPVADYDFGPIHLRQGQATGPDGVPVVFVEIAHRLPSVLDSRPDLLHSDLHSVVWCVDDLDAATAFWTDVVGLDLRNRFPITHPAVPAFMGLPRPSHLAMSVLTASGLAAPRVELLAYEGEPGAVVPVVPLLSGATIPVLRVGDLDEVLTRLLAAGSQLRDVVVVPRRHGAERAVVVSGPAGTGLELRASLR